VKKEALIQLLTLHHEEFSDYIVNLHEADFSFSFKNKWTAGQQMDHIVRSTSVILLACRVPRIITRLLFGIAVRPSRTYENLVEAYVSKLDKGAKASRIFVPGRIAFANRARLSAKMLTNVSKICTSMARYSENEMDKYMLPHPILGKLTIREMMYFAIYHVQHHSRFTKKNLANK
jgi:hypothetical protein